MISLTDQKYQNKSACKGQGPKEMLNHLTLINRHNQYISSEMFLKAAVGLRYICEGLRNCPIIYLIAVSSPHAPGMWRPDYCQIRQAQKQHNMICRWHFFSMTALFISETLCKITVDLQ